MSQTLRDEPGKPHCTSANIALFQLPELVALCVRLVHLSERDVHEVVAVDEMSVEGLAILEFDQLLDRKEAKELRSAIQRCLVD